VKRQTLIIAASIVIAVFLVTVGIYFATHGSGTTTSNPTATPKPTETATTSPSASETPMVTPTPTRTTSVAAASSMHFQVSITNSLGQIQDVYEYQVKNIGTSNLKLRVEMSPAGGSNITYIVNGALQKAWIWADGQWTDMSSSFTSQWSTWNDAFVGYKTKLTNWTGHGDYTYTTANGDSIRIYDITINPLLQDQSFTI
jgi:hypothetical protein